MESADIAPEISGSRSSYEIEGAQIIQALVKIIVGLCVEDGKFSGVVFKQVHFDVNLSNIAAGIRLFRSKLQVLF